MESVGAPYERVHRVVRAPAMAGVPAVAELVGRQVAGACIRGTIGVETRLYDTVMISRAERADPGDADRVADEVFPRKKLGDASRDSGLVRIPFVAELCQQRGGVG